MQTRKRAKSITFGKPKKEEEVKPKAAEEEKVVAPTEEKPKVSEEPKKTEEVKETPELSEPVEPAEPTEAAKKIMAIEESEKELSSDLSSTLSSEEPTSTDKSEEKEEEKVISSDNFVIDTDASKAVDEKASEEDKEPEASTTDVLSPVVEPETGTESKSETSELSSSNGEELSSTPPPSAFSIQDENDDTGEAGGKKRHFLVYFLVIALFSFILGLGAMAVLSSGILPGVSIPKELPFVSEIGKAVQPPVAQPTAVPTTAVQPTVAPTEKPVDLAAYTVSVLNGSGIKGKAAEVKTSLTTAGFKVGTTGNAANSNFTETEISAKKDVEQAYIDKLKAELEKDFVVKVSSAPAPASQATDVVVTIGSDTAK